MTKRQVAVLTTSRADYGILYWLLRSIDADEELELLLYVSGSHFVPELGMTANEIDADGFDICRKLEIFSDVDTPTAATTAMSIALTGIGEALEADKPNVLVLLGDRFEIVPAALAAVVHGVPVAHIHGGETSEGAIDEYFRHAITKLSTYHFAATDQYRRRIIQMGEYPPNVFNFGAPALDHLPKTNLLSKSQLEEALNLSIAPPTALVTYHPVTATPGRYESQIENMMEAILATEDLQCIITSANADVEGQQINQILRSYCDKHSDRMQLFDSLGYLRYLSCLRTVDLMIGNSSSGLIEAPSFRRPVVNIGDRQRGRVSAKNVIHTDNSTNSIRKSIDQALSNNFVQSLESMTNPYDTKEDGEISVRIKEKLKELINTAPPAGKTFHDLN